MPGYFGELSTFFQHLVDKSLRLSRILYLLEDKYNKVSNDAAQWRDIPPYDSSLLQGFLRHPGIFRQSLQEAPLCCH